MLDSSIQENVKKVSNATQSECRFSLGGTLSCRNICIDAFIGMSLELKTLGYFGLLLSLRFIFCIFAP